MYPEIRAALDRIGPDLRDRSGSVMYSGRSAFSSPSDLYVLGLNPGGSPDLQAAETIGRWMDDWESVPAAWSVYADQAWLGHAPGTYGIQPRMLHLFKQLQRDPKTVPASNLIFARTQSEAGLGLEMRMLIEQCWPVHDAVIEALGVRFVLCLGGTVGREVRKKLNAHMLVGTCAEKNARKWRFIAHDGEKGIRVVTLTHPARADWRNPLADPSEFVKQMMQDAAQDQCATMP